MKVLSDGIVLRAHSLLIAALAQATFSSDHLQDEVLGKEHYERLSCKRPPEF